MISHYPFMVSFRRRYKNESKMPMARYYNKEGKEMLKLVHGKPYYDGFRDNMHFDSLDKAEDYIRRKRESGKAGYIRLHEGDYEVEETYL